MTQADPDRAAVRDFLRSETYYLMRRAPSGGAPRTSSGVWGMDVEHGVGSGRPGDQEIDVTVLADFSTLPGVAGSSERLVERVALALNSTLHLEEVLVLLAEAGLEATGAGGTAVLLLHGRRLVPATVVRTIADDTLHERFTTMPPIELDAMRWDLLHAGQAIVFEDARTSELIPQELTERFTLRGFALVPLMASGQPFGVMCVDWDEPRVFSPNDVALLEALGAYAGMAVRNARLYETMRQRARLQEALAHSAASLALPLDAATVAAKLAKAYTDLLRARLCSVVLFDADLDTITTMASEGGRPLPEDTRISDVPRSVVDPLVNAWVEVVEPVEFGDEPWLAENLGGREAGASWYLMLPLNVEGATRGVVTLGFALDMELDAQERSAAAALADLAAAALERHSLLQRLDAQVSRRDALYEASAALNSSTALRPVLDLVCAAFEKLLGTSHCSVNLVDPAYPDLLRTLSYRGVPWFAGRPDSIGAVAPGEVAKARALWAETARPVVYATIDERLALEPLLVPTAVRSAVLFPLVHAGRILGLVVAGWPRRGVAGADDLDTGQALAGLAATAIDRAQLNDDLHLRLRQVEALYQLSDLVAGRADLDTAVRELNRLFEPGLGVVFGSVALTNREARSAVGARSPDMEELEAIRSWRSVVGTHTHTPRPRRTPLGLLVPVVHRSRVYGSLRVALSGPQPDPSTEDLLVAIGAGCAEIVYKARLHHEVADRERRLAIAAERERIARDLHDSVGQVLTGMGMLLTEYVEEASDDTWRSRLEELVGLTERGAREVRDSVYSLMFLETRRVGLVASLRALTTKFEAMTGIAMAFEVVGEPTEMTSAREAALFRVAHEALMNVERHALASRAAVELRYGETEVSLTVRDDGVGLGRHVDDGRRHLGLAAIEGRLDEVGGDLNLSTSADGGAVVEAHVPSATRSRRSHPTL